MPRRKIVKAGSEFRSINIHKVDTYAYPLADRKPGEPNGYVDIRFSPSSNWGDHKIARFDLISVWLDPNRADAQRTCKIHLSLPKVLKSEEHKNAGKIVEYLRSLPGARRIDTHGNPSMSLLVDDHDDILRYGSQESPYKSAPNGSYNYIPVYDSKAEAFNSIMEAIKYYQSGAVVGVDLINLDSISDQVMEEMGFTKVPDQMGLSTPMWSGDARSITSLGRDKYGSSSYSRKTNDNSSKEVVESFLDLIESDLSIQGS